MADGIILALDFHAAMTVLGLLEHLGQILGELVGGVGQLDAVLRAFRAGDGRHDRTQVQLQRGGVERLFLFRAPQALRLGIGLDQLDPLGIAARGLQIAQRVVVGREEAAGRAIFRRHVGNRGLVLDRHRVQPLAEELDELADHAVLAKHVGDRQHQVGGGHALGQLAGQLEADDLRDQHGNRLAEHRGLGLDAAHAPAQNRQAVDHGGVAVRADKGVRHGVFHAVFFLGPDRLTQIFQIHLVTDAGARRHDAEILERARAPFQEFIALQIALVLALHVLLECGRVAEIVDHDGVVDDEVNLRLRIDGVRVRAQLLRRVAHGGQVHHGGNAGEVLQQDARGLIGDFGMAGAFFHPVANRFDLRLGDQIAVFAAQQILKQHFQRVGQSRNAVEAVLLGLLQVEIYIGLVADLHFAAAIETVLGRHGRAPYHRDAFE